MRVLHPRGWNFAFCHSLLGTASTPDPAPCLNTPNACLQALNNLGVLYTSQGRAGEAIALLQAAVAAAPLYAEAWNNLGVAQRDIGDVVASIASYERAAALAPEQPNAGVCGP